MSYVVSTLQHKLVAFPWKYISAKAILPKLEAQLGAENCGPDCYLTLVSLSVSEYLEKWMGSSDDYS